MAGRNKVDDYNDLIETAAAEKGIPANLLRSLIVQESGGNPNAVGPRTPYGNPLGIAQMLPSTARGLGVKDPFDPNQAIPGAAEYLKQGFEKTGSEAGAAMFYHGGPNQRIWGPKTRAYASEVTGRKAEMDRTSPAKDRDLEALEMLRGVYGGASSPAKVEADTTDADLEMLRKAYGGPSESAPAPASDPAPMVITVKPSGVLDNAKDDGMLASAAKNIGTGVVKGVGGAIGAFGSTKELADYLYARAKSGITGQPLEQVQARQQQLEQEFGSPLASYIPTGQQVTNKLLGATGEYTPTSGWGKAAQTGISSVVGAMGPGSIAQRGGAGTVAAASPLIAAGGVASDEVARATGDPLLGLAAGAAAPAGAALGAKGIAALAGRTTPEVAALAETARNKHGIDINAGQLTDSWVMRNLADLSKKVPFGGGGKQAETQRVQYNQAVTRLVGEETPKVSGDYMARQRDRIGKDFDAAAAATPHIAADQRFQSDIVNLHRNMQATVPTTEQPAIVRNIQNVLDAIDPQTGGISGTQYQKLTRKGGELDSAMQSKNPNIREAAGEVRDALDGAMQRSAPPEAKAQLAKARQQWRVLRTIEDPVAKSTDGNLSPGLVQGRILAKTKGTHGAAYGGGGDLTEIGKIGNMLMDPKSSGTAERANLLQQIGGLSGAAMMLHDPTYGAGILASTAMPSVVGRAAGSALRSDWLTNALLARSQGRGTRVGNELLQLALTPGSLPALARR